MIFPAINLHGQFGDFPAGRVWLQEPAHDEDPQKSRSEVHNAPISMWNPMVNDIMTRYQKHPKTSLSNEGNATYKAMFWGKKTTCGHDIDQWPEMR